MKKRQVYILIACTLFCVFFLFGFYVTSPMNRELRPGPFTRNFVGTSLTFERKLDLGFNSFYIAGVANNTVYLANYTSPFFLVTTDSHLTDTTSATIKLGIDSIVDPLRFRMVVDSPRFYLSNGIMPEILSGTLGKWYATPCIDTVDYFSDVKPIGPHSVIYRSYSNKTKSYELAHKRSGMPFKFNADLLVKQIDGLFCVDGQLLANSKSGDLVYVAYHKNEFIVADTNLNLKYRGHTIDTFKHARVKITQFKNENKSMLSEPPVRINRNSCVSNGLLFVESSLLSSNEDKQSFMNGSPIDVYDLKNKGTYIGSFYLPSDSKGRAREWVVIKDKVIGLYDNSILEFKIQDIDLLTAGPGI